MAVEALDCHAVIEGWGILLSAVNPGGQMVLLLWCHVGQIFEVHEVLSLIIEKWNVLGRIASKLPSVIYNCMRDYDSLNWWVETPIWHEALRDNCRDALIKGSSLESDAGAIEEAPNSDAVWIDPASVLQELFNPLTQIVIHIMR